MDEAAQLYSDHRDFFESRKVKLFDTLSAAGDKLKAKLAPRLVQSQDELRGFDDIQSSEKWDAVKVARVRAQDALDYYEAIELINEPDFISPRAGGARHFNSAAIRNSRLPSAPVIGLSVSPRT